MVVSQLVLQMNRNDKRPVNVLTYAISPNCNGGVASHLSKGV